MLQSILDLLFLTIESQIISVAGRKSLGVETGQRTEGRVLDWSRGGVLLAVAVHPFRFGYFNFFTGGCRTRNEQSISEMVCLDTAVESGGSETGPSDTGDVWGLRWPASGGKSFSSRMESLLNS